jgi:hypothetical protein
MPILLLAKELGRGMVGRKLIDWNGEPIPTKQLSNKEQKTKDAKQLDDMDLSTHGVQCAEVIPEYQREIPFWCQNQTFIDGLLKFVYSADTQRAKIQFTKQLIHLYWVLATPTEEVLKDLDLTAEGLKKRLQRLNAKAIEYNKLTNTFAEPEPTVDACGTWKEVSK